MEPLIQTRHLGQTARVSCPPKLRAEVCYRKCMGSAPGLGPLCAYLAHLRFFPVQSCLRPCSPLPPRPGLRTLLPRSLCSGRASRTTNLTGR